MSQPNNPQPTVIVTQNQSQRQYGCCGGPGCGIVFLVALILAGLAAVWEAMMGVYGLWWAVGSWVGSVLLVGLLLLAGFAWADQKFGWGFTDAQVPPEQQNSKTAEEVLDQENYGTQAHPFETHSRGVREPANGPESRAAEELPEGGTLHERIRELGRLRDDGLITDAEFEEKKRELLRRM